MYFFEGPAWVLCGKCATEAGGRDDGTSAPVGQRGERGLYHDAPEAALLCLAQKQLENG